jgi:hypothetical protein
VLVRPLWQLTVLVGERATARQLRQDLAASGVGVPARSATALIGREVEEVRRSGGPSHDKGVVGEFRGSAGGRGTT